MYFTNIKCVTAISASRLALVLSDAEWLLYGVPQGNILGPILFSLYTTLSKGIENHPGICLHFDVDAHVKLHFWLQTLWLKVVLTNVILCL